MEEYLPKLRVIPFNSLGKQNGLLLGLMVDKITIKNDEYERTLNQIIVGIYDKFLSKNKSYTALIGLDILERCDKNEYFANAKI